MSNPKTLIDALNSDLSEQLFEEKARVELSKALTACIVSAWAKREEASRSHIQGHPVQRNPHEPLNVPVSRIPIAFDGVVKAEQLTSCNACGYIHKSTEGCTLCSRVQAHGGEAPEYWCR